MHGKNDAPVSRSRERQRRWREKLPELHRLVEDIAPRMWKSTEEDRVENVPEEWKSLVSQMQRDVHAEAESADYHDEDSSAEDRRGYHWNWKVHRVGDMLEYLTRTIRQDLGFDDETTLASIALLQKATLYLQLELQDGGTKHGREDSLENRYRVQQALMALAPRFDDVPMLRLRALQVAESAARFTQVPNDDDVEQRVQRICEKRSLDPEAQERHRNWMTVDLPAMNGVLARSWLMEVDERFGALDPLVVMEEFAAASAESDGGRTEGGDGRTGPVRALARLSVSCGALDFGQKDDEDFDTAVERARGNLVTTRFRFRKAVRAFPTGKPNQPEQY